MKRALLQRIHLSLQKSDLASCLRHYVALSIPNNDLHGPSFVTDNKSVIERGRREIVELQIKRGLKNQLSLEDNVDESGEVEKRKVRTKPKRKDYSQEIQELQDCVQWKEEYEPVGKYLELPGYDPDRRDGEDGNIDLECLPDKWEFVNPFTQQKHAFDFSMLPIQPEDDSQEAKALRWIEENIPLRDEDLPIALRNPDIRKKTLEEAFGPNSRPKDAYKIFAMEPPTAQDIDPWVEEQFGKLPMKDGKITGMFALLTHPRTLRAAVEYLKVMKPTVVPDHVPNDFIEELSELLKKRKWVPHYEPPDPPNPYRMEQYEQSKSKVSRNRRRKR